MSFNELLNPKPGNINTARDEGQYNIIRFKPNPTATLEEIPNQQLKYPFSGRFLYVDAVLGGAHAQVRFGKTGAWIDVEEGDLLEIEYKEVWVRDVSYPQGAFLGNTPLPEIVLYTSWTPIKRKTDSRVGYEAGFFTFNGLVATTTITSLVRLTNTIAVNSRNKDILIKLKNIDLVATLYYMYRLDTGIEIFAAGTFGFPIMAGETETFLFKGKRGPFNQSRSSVAPYTPGTFADICIATDSPTCNFALLMSPGFDHAGDSDNRNQLVDY